LPFSIDREKRLDGVPHLLPALVDQAQVVERVGIVGLDLDGLLHQIGGLAQVLASGQGASEVVERFGLPVVQRHRLPELLLRFLELAALDQQPAEPGPVAGLLGIELDRLAERFHRPLGLAHAPQQRSVFERQGSVRVELRQRDLHLPARSRKLAVRRQRLAHA